MDQVEGKYCWPQLYQNRGVHGLKSHMPRYFSHFWGRDWRKARAMEKLKLPPVTLHIGISQNRGAHAFLPSMPGSHHQCPAALQEAEQHLLKLSVWDWTCHTPGRSTRGDAISIQRFAHCWDTARHGAHTPPQGSGRGRKDTKAGTSSPCPGLHSKTITDATEEQHWQIAGTRI